MEIMAPRFQRVHRLATLSPTCIASPPSAATGYRHHDLASSDACRLTLSVAGAAFAWQGVYMIGHVKLSGAGRGRRGLKSTLRMPAGMLQLGQWKAFGKSFYHSAELCLLWPESSGLEDFQDEYGKTISELKDAYSCCILCACIHSMIQFSAQQDVKSLQVLEGLINIGLSDRGT